MNPAQVRKMDFKVFESSEKNVWKYVFTKEDMVAEAILYRYEDFYERTLIYYFKMSGCPVGCKFCGTGHKFVRNLTAGEIAELIITILKDKAITDVDQRGKRFQIMFMSMGIAPKRPEVWERVIQLSKEVDKVGLQFSIHKAIDNERDILIPYKNKLSLQIFGTLGLSDGKV
ncbi:MAG: hypothetical protein K2N63_09625 [Lachnospiraceae bacterium]|nr:hypothetical protein [Lachnospiraceae bacterium]